MKNQFRTLFYALVLITFGLQMYVLVKLHQKNKEPVIVVNQEKSMKYDVEIQKTVPQLYLNGASGFIKWYENQTLTGGTGKLTLAGGNLDVGSNSLLTTGSISSTSSRVTKGWFTNLEITNPPTVNGVPLGTGISLDAPVFTTRITTPQIVLGSTPLTVLADEINRALSGSLFTAAEGNILHNLDLNTINIRDITFLPTVISAAGDTSSYPIPGKIGNIYINTSNGKVYVSVKAIRHNGWQILN
jgi:hypothetical protein